MGIRKKTTRPREFAELGERANAGASAREKLRFVAVVNDDWTADDAMEASTPKIQHSEIEGRHAPLAEPWTALGERVTWEDNPMIAESLATTRLIAKQAGTPHPYRPPDKPFQPRRMP